MLRGERRLFRELSESGELGGRGWVPKEFRELPDVLRVVGGEQRRVQRRRGPVPARVEVPYWLACRDQEIIGAPAAALDSRVSTVCVHFRLCSVERSAVHRRSAHCCGPGTWVDTVRFCGECGLILFGFGECVKNEKIDHKRQTCMAVICEREFGDADGRAGRRRAQPIGSLLRSHASRYVSHSAHSAGTRNACPSYSRMLHPPPSWHTQSPSSALEVTIVPSAS